MKTCSLLTLPDETEVVNCISDAEAVWRTGWRAAEFRSPGRRDGMLCSGFELDELSVGPEREDELSSDPYSASCAEKGVVVAG